MDRRTLLAIVTFIGLYYAYVFVIRPMVYPEPPPQVETAATPDAGGASGDGLVEAGVDAGTDAPLDPTVDPVPSPEAPAAAPRAPERSVPFKACQASGTVSSRAGALGDMSMDDWEGPYEVQPIYMYLLNLVTGSGDTNWKPYGPPPGPQQVASDESRFLTVGSGNPDGLPTSLTIEQSGDVLVTRGRTRDGIDVERTVRPSDDDPCVLQVDVSWTNSSGRDFDGPLWLGLHDVMPEAASAYAHVPKPYWSVDGSWNSYTYPKTGGYLGLYKALEAPERVDGDTDWFGMSDGYFTFVVVPQGGNNGRLVISPLDIGAELALADPLDVPEDTVLYGHHYMIDGVAAGATVSQSFVAYVGPIDSDVLSQIHPTLYYLVDLGWFAFFGRPLLWLLNLYHQYVGNWGLSIILLTVTVKLVFFPLTQMAFQSSQRMQLLQPELKKIREQFADNQEELNKRTMAMFRENKVNPVGGCLPMVIQMPIWIALYRVLLTHVDLYHTKFLYLTDLSVQDPYAILPLIVVGLMFAQQQLMPTGNMDPNQARIMKFMPLIFGFLFFSFPSGLVLYIFVNMLLTILQQWFIKRRFKTVTPAPATATAES
jgi:YidC/Oxa1 family membrane protein insertase